MEQNLRVGLTAVGSYLTKSEHAAKHVGSGEVEVLSTPAMIVFMEKTARQAVESKLPEGEITVSARKPKTQNPNLVFLLSKKREPNIFSEKGIKND